MLPTGNIRADICVFVVLDKIISYESVNEGLKINCINDVNFIVNISKYSFEQMLLNSIRLNNILKYRKFKKLV